MNNLKLLKENNFIFLLVLAGCYPCVKYADINYYEVYSYLALTIFFVATFITSYFVYFIVNKLPLVNITLEAKKGLLLICIIVFFNYNDFLNTEAIKYLASMLEISLSPRTKASIMYFAFVTLALWMFVKYRHKRNLWLMVNVYIVILFGFHSANILLKGGMLRIDTSYRTDNFQLQSDKNIERPNIYFLLLDAYVGDPSLLHRGDSFDNSGFYNYLKNRKFVIFDTYANFPFTGLSLPSTLDMKYINDENNTTRKKSFKDLDHPFVHMLKEKYGYYIVSFPVYKGNCSNIEDECIIGATRDTTLRTLISMSEMSPLYKVMNVLHMPIPHWLGYQYQDTDYVFEWFNSNVNRLKKPFFVFMHNMDAHENVYPDKTCLFDYNDGKYYKEKKFDLMEKNYIQTVKCLNNKIENFINRVLQNDPKAVIILQSDHGPLLSEQHSNMNDWSAESLELRFRAFNAIRIPEKTIALKDKKIVTLVNTFRVVSNLIFDESFTLLPNKSYFVDANTWESKIKIDLNLWRDHDEK